MRAFLPVLAAFALSACGLSPMYAQGSAGGAGRALGAIEVAPIPDQAGWLMRDALLEQLEVGPDQTPRYRLDVRLDDRLEGLGLLGDDTIGRQRRTLRARYRLVDLATGETILDATAGSDAGIDVVSSEYATIAAEQRALENLTKQVAERIVSRVSLKLRAIAPTTG